MPVGGDERLGRGHPVAGHAPLGRTADDAGGQLGQGIGHEGAGDAGLGVAVGPVGEDGLGGAHRGRRVGHVVGQHLGLVRDRRRRAGRRCRRRRPTWPRRWRQRRRGGRGRGSCWWSPHKDNGPSTGRDFRRGGPTASGHASAGRPLGYHGDQRWEHDRVVSGIDTGEQLEVVGHRSGPGTGRRLGPGVDDVEAGVAGRARAAGRRCRGAGHRASRRACRRSVRPR